MTISQSSSVPLWPTVWAKLLHGTLFRASHSTEVKSWWSKTWWGLIQVWSKSAVFFSVQGQKKERKRGNHFAYQIKKNNNKKTKLNRRTHWVFGEILRWAWKTASQFHKKVIILSTASSLTTLHWLLVRMQCLQWRYTCAQHNHCVLVV